MEIRFKLNPKNEKDKVIIDVLSGEYSPAETIKNIMYKMATNGGEGQRRFNGGQIYLNNGFPKTDSTPQIDYRQKKKNELGGVNECYDIESEKFTNDIKALFL